MNGTGAAKPFGRERLPQTAGAQHKHDGLENHPRRLGFAPTAGLADEGFLRVTPRPGWNQRLNATPERIRDFPRLGSHTLGLGKNESRIIG